MKVENLRVWFDLDDNGWYAACDGPGMDPLFGPTETEEKARTGLNRALIKMGWEVDLHLKLVK